MYSFLKRSVLTVGLTAALMIQIVASPVASAASGYYCGNSCDGVSPNYTIKVNGITCSHSAKEIAHGNPQATYDATGAKNTYDPRTDIDSGITVKVLYSSVCQTMWMTVSNTYTAPRESCSLRLVRTIKTTWTSPAYHCPIPGKTVTTPMVNDYSSSNGKAAKVGISFTKQERICDHSSDGFTCDHSFTGPVTFSYGFSY